MNAWFNTPINPLIWYQIKDHHKKIKKNVLELEFLWNLVQALIRVVKYSSFKNKQFISYLNRIIVVLSKWYYIRSELGLVLLFYSELFYMIWIEIQKTVILIPQGENIEFLVEKHVHIGKPFLEICLNLNQSLKAFC